METLHRSGACELADAVARGEQRAEDVVAAHLGRIERHDGELGAFVYVDAEGAQARARALDAALASGATAGPLAGVPIGVKVLEDVAGWPHTMAARVFADRVATTTSTQVARLVAAGAIPVGLTASPEMGGASFTASELYGVCRNPWDRDRTPGGSSGGSAAAVVAGLVPLATGSDSGGSLRIPAAYTGTVGFKGTYGRVPRGPNYVGMPNVRCYGALARTPRDVARFLDVVTGADERDPLSLPAPAQPFEQQLFAGGALEGLRATWTADLGFGACDGEVASHVRAAASRLCRAAGLEERDVTVQLTDPERAWQVFGAPDVLGIYGPFEAERAEEIHPFFRRMLEQGRKLTGTDFTEAAQLRDTLAQRVADLFEQVDLLLLPTVAVPAFAAAGPMPSEIGGRAVSALGTVAQTYTFNLSGHPAISLPAGSVGGAPVGLQVVARRHDDARLLALAQCWWDAEPWPTLAPDYAG